MVRQPFRECLSDAIRYWEIRRFLYNGVLAAIVVVHFVLNLPASKKSLSFDWFLLLVVLAVLANVAYCAAYVVAVARAPLGATDGGHRLCGYPD